MIALLSVIILLSSLPRTLNPLYIYNEGETPIVEMLYLSPLRFGPDGKLQDYGAHLIKLKGKTAVLEMKSGFKWEDGREISPEDLRFTFNFLSKDKTSVFSQAWKGIRAEKEGRKVIVYFPKKVKPYLFTFPILPLHILKGKNPKELRKIPASGAYRVKKWESGRLVLERKDFPYSVAFGEITFLESRDPATSILMVRSGKVDIAVLSPLFLPTKNFKGKIYKISHPAFLYLGFNLRDRKLSDKKFRCWISRQVPYREITMLRENFARVIKSPFQIWKDNLPYKGCTETERLKGNFSILVPSESKIRVQIAQVLQDIFSRKGIKIRIEMLERGAFLKRLHSGNFQMVLSAFSLDSLFDFEEIFFKRGGANYFNYLSSEMEEALKNNEWRKAHSIFLKDLPFIPIFQSQYPIAVKEKIRWAPYTKAFSSASPFRSIIGKRD